jgi:transcription elongation factor Elf1
VFAEGLGGVAMLRKKRPSAKETSSGYVEPITCPHCGRQAFIMRRTLHPKIKGEIRTFECKDCGKQTEKSVLH